MAIQLNPFTGQLDLVGGGGVSIGMPIGGSTPFSLLSVSATNTLAQLGPLTNGQLLIGSTGADAVPATLTSTANQVTATIGVGSITLSLPQDIAITSSPQFANLILTPSGSLDITGAGGTLAIGTTNADIINIGNTGAVVNVQGTTFYQNVTDLLVTDKRITLNYGGSVGSASNSGIEIAEAIQATTTSAGANAGSIFTATAIGVAGNGIVITVVDTAPGPVTVVEGVGTVLIDLAGNAPVDQTALAIAGLTLVTLNGVSLIAPEVFPVTSGGVGSVTAYVDTSADRNSWQLKAPATAGIVTITPGALGFTIDQGSHDPVTIGTANGLSLSTQVLSLQLATTLLNGALSSTDWNAFTAKVDGPASSVDSEVAIFNSTTGKLLKRATGTGVAHLTAGVLSASNVDLTTEVTGALPIANGGTGQITNTLAFNALSPTTTIGDIIAHNGTDNVRVAGNPLTTQLFLSSIGNGTNSTLPSWQPLPALGVLTYFITNTASDVATYYKQQTSPLAVLNNIPTVITNVGTPQLLANFVTEPNNPNRTFISAGQYSNHLHLSSTGGTRTVSVYTEIWEVNASGVDIALIATLGNTSPLTGVNSEYLIATNRLLYLLASNTSRIDTRVYAITTGGGSDPTVTIFMGGASDSRTDLPAPTVDITNYVPYIGATATLNLNTQNLTTTGTITGVVTGNLLTGFVSGAGTVAATDTILQGFNKLDGNIATKVTTVVDDIIPTSWAGITDNTINQVVTGFLFATTVSSFEALVSIYIDATVDLFTTVKIKGTRKDLTDWTTNDITWSFTGDAIDSLDFNIIPSGQIIMNNGAITGFVSGIVKFRAITL